MYLFNNNENITEYSLIKHLKMISESDEKYKNLYALWVLDEEMYSKALMTIINTFPHYSMHDSSHSWSIINKIEMILGENRIKQLSPTDAFLILESAFLHDFGMIVTDKEQKDLWNNPEFKKYIDDIKKYNYDKDLLQAVNYLEKINEKVSEKNEESWPIDVKRYVTLLNADYFRRTHNYRSYNIIMDSNELGIVENRSNLIPERLMRLIAQFSVIHGTEFNSILENLYKEDNGIGTDKIHPRMIASLLRLGDLLDLDNGRFNEVLVKTIEIPENSMQHRRKHQAITHFLVSPEKIEVEAICPDEKVYRVTREWLEWLQDELKNLSSKWSEIVPSGFWGGPPSLGTIKLSIKGDKDICEQLDFKFKMEQKVAMTFVEGEGIYYSKFECIREIIQNALDATKIRIWNDIESGRYDLLPGCIDIGKNKEKLKFSNDIPPIIRNFYPIIIKLEDIKNDEENKFMITIEDSGTGISIEDLKRIEKVGSSWSSNLSSYTKINNMPRWMKPTGSFGIGLHSVFMITDEVVYETKCENECGYTIKFVSSKENGYISVSKNSKLNKIGTKVMFKFSKDICKSINLEDLSVDIAEMIENNEREIDLVSKSYEDEKALNRLICIINSHINNINSFRFIKEGLLKDDGYDDKLDEILEDESKKFKLKGDVMIKVEEEEDNGNILAIVKDTLNESELEFKLLERVNDDKNTSVPLLLYAIGLKSGGKDELGKILVYYKNFYCEKENFKLFNIKLNCVESEAKVILSINRNKFRDKERLDKYIRRIEEVLIPIVIEEMWKEVNEEKVNEESEIFEINKVVLALYYRAYCNKEFDLNCLKECDSSFERRKYDCIRKVDIDRGYNNPATLKELIEAKSIIITKTINCNQSIQDLAKEYKISIILDDIVHINEIERIQEQLKILNFHKIEYIDNSTYIAHKDIAYPDSNIIQLDYSKKERVKEYLKMLYPKESDEYNKFPKRFIINSFEYINNKDSTIKFLITKEHKIISPFTKSDDSTELDEILEKYSKGNKESKGDKDNIERIVKFLREKYKFNELLEYVYKNSLEKDNTVEKIEKAYEELINDYIEFVYKSK